MSQKKKYFKILSPPEDLKALKKKVRWVRFRKIRRLTANIVLAALAVCGTYLLLDTQTYGEVRTAAEYEANTSDSSSYVQFSNGIVRYNRDGVSFLNKKNEELWIQPTQLQNPFIVINDNSFAVGDNGGNSIFVFSEEGLKGEIQTTLPIEKITVSDQGIVSAILKNENSPKIITYDATGNILAELQATTGTTGYPADLELSDDGNTLAVSYLTITATGLNSSLIYYNFGTEGQKKTDNIVSSSQYESTVIADVFFMDSQRSVAVADNCFIIYNGCENPSEERVIPVTQEIQSVFHSDKYIGLILLNKEKSGYELHLYSQNGDLILNRNLPGKYDNMKIDGDEILLYTGSRCCIMTVTGITKFAGDVKGDVQEMFRARGLNRYYVMNADKLRIIYLTK